MLGAIMFSIVYITAGDMEEAKKIGKILVEERLAACVNIFPITSIFRWKNNIEDAQEFGIMAKTKSRKVKEIEKRVKEIHSYEVPCVISFRIDEGSLDYIRWIDESVED
jgi:periplasmic divalent cation tolerance protein